MKFKLINRVTNEEYICNKVTIGNFNYYVVDNITTDTNYFIQSISLFKRINESNVRQEWRTTDFIHGCSVKTGLNYSFDSDDKSCKKVIATNNPNIDIPKVIDEITKVFKNHFDIDSTEDFPKTVGDTNIIEYFKEGYNKSQQDFPFSEEDMIEFANWKYFNFFQRIRDVLYYTLSARPMSKILDKDKGYTTKELLEIWKSKQLKVLYYE